MTYIHLNPSAIAGKNYSGKFLVRILPEVHRKLAIQAAESLIDLNVPGFNFHSLQGRPKCYSIHVNGPWCITFEWEEGEALRVDLEQYH